MNSSVDYAGPRAAFATLGGSPTWGLGDRFHEFAATRGHARLGLSRPPTPYGLGPQVEHYRGPSGREFLRILDDIGFFEHRPLVMQLGHRGG